MKIMMIAMCIGIGIAISFGVGFAISLQTVQTGKVAIAETPEGRHFEIELRENVSAGDRPSP